MGERHSTASLTSIMAKRPLRIVGFSWTAALLVLPSITATWLPVATMPSSHVARLCFPTVSFSIILMLRLRCGFWMAAFSWVAGITSFSLFPVFP